MLQQITTWVVLAIQSCMLGPLFTLEAFCFLQAKEEFWIVSIKYYIITISQETFRQMKQSAGYKKNWLQGPYSTISTQSTKQASRMTAHSKRGLSKKRG